MIRHPKNCVAFMASIPARCPHFSGVAHLAVSLAWSLVPIAVGAQTTAVLVQTFSHPHMIPWNDVPRGTFSTVDSLDP